MITAIDKKGKLPKQENLWDLLCIIREICLI